MRAELSHCSSSFQSCPTGALSLHSCPTVALSKAWLLDKSGYQCCSREITLTLAYIVCVVCVCRCTDLCGHVWRPEVDIVTYFLIPSPHFFKKGFLFAFGYVCMPCLGVCVPVEATRSPGEELSSSPSRHPESCLLVSPTVPSISIQLCFHVPTNVIFLSGALCDHFNKHIHPS